MNSWPEFVNMLGASYDNHPWNTVTAPVINEDPRFPATKLPRRLPIMSEAS
jgi:hypothetical protein